MCIKPPTCNSYLYSPIKLAPMFRNWKCTWWVKLYTYLNRTLSFTTKAKCITHILDYQSCRRRCVYTKTHDGPKFGVYVWVCVCNLINKLLATPNRNAEIDAPKTFALVVATLKSYWRTSCFRVRAERIPFETRRRSAKRFLIEQPEQTRMMMMMPMYMFALMIIGASSTYIYSGGRGWWPLVDEDSNYLPFNDYVVLRFQIENLISHSYHLYLFSR